MASWTAPCRISRQAMVARRGPGAAALLLRATSLQAREERMPVAEVTLEDLERLDDRLAHAQQFMEEALKAVREATVLAAKIDPDDEEAA
jgi:hypothetical protein